MVVQQIYSNSGEKYEVEWIRVMLRPVLILNPVDGSRDPKVPRY